MYYESGDISTTEIVIDDGESTLTKKFPKKIVNKEIILETNGDTFEASNTTEPQGVEEVEISTTTEELEVLEEVVDEKTDGQCNTCEE